VGGGLKHGFYISVTRKPALFRYARNQGPSGFMTSASSAWRPRDARLELAVAHWGAGKFQRFTPGRDPERAYDRRLPFGCLLLARRALLKGWGESVAPRSRAAA